MIEVFKTNVQDPGHAAMLIRLIHEFFPGYQANFDLHDCDRILRIKSAKGIVDPGAVINLLKTSGFSVEVLPEVLETSDHDRIIQKIADN
jgi:hypothetical protein